MRSVIGRVARKAASDTQRQAVESILANSSAMDGTMRVRFHPLVLVSRWDSPDCLRRRYQDVDLVLVPYGTPNKSLPHGVAFATQFEATAKNCTTRSCPKRSLPRGACTGFYGGSSRWAKLAFVVWLAISSHTHAWHVEDDVVSVDGWRSLARRYEKSDADLVAQFQWNQNHAYYMDHTTPAIPGCSICAERAGLTAWPLLRMSRSLARAVLKEVMHEAEGHHEILVLAVCYRLPGCRWRFLEDAKQQLIVNTHRWRTIPSKSRVALAMLQQPGEHYRYFHPLKCRDEHEALRRALQGHQKCDVILKKHESVTPCRRGIDFGCFQDGRPFGMWVANGCEGTFIANGQEFYCRGSNHPGEINVSAPTETLSCQPRIDYRNHVPLMRLGQVTPPQMWTLSADGVHFVRNTTYVQGVQPSRGHQGEMGRCSL